MPWRLRHERSESADVVDQLREDVRKLSAVVEGLSEEMADWRELAAPGPERPLILDSAQRDGTNRRALCSLAVGPYVELLAISSITFEAYAAVHGYDLRLSTQLHAGSARGVRRWWREQDRARTRAARALRRGAVGGRGCDLP